MSCYLYQRHSGYPDMLGKRLKDLLKYYKSYSYYSDLQTALVKQPLFCFEFAAKPIPSDYVYKINIPDMKLTAYHNEKRVPIK